MQLVAVAACWLSLVSVCSSLDFSLPYCFLTLPFTTHLSILSSDLQPADAPSSGPGHALAS